MTRDFFTVLGVPRRYHLSTEDLEKRFLALSKELHPDRHAQATPKERLMAVTRTTELNDAYRVLKNAVKRAEYLAKLEGYDVADEKASKVKADPALLMEMMELNEQLTEDPASVTARVRADRDRTLAQVDELFLSYENGERDGVLPKIAQALIALRYYARLLERVEGDDGEPSGAR